MDKVIFHCDCNNFFASVELLFLPELRDKPVAVCRTDDARHGIVLAKNELAKKFGVKTAEAAWEARRKCPELVFVPPHRKLYSQYAKQINEIYARYTDLVQPASIDESYLDVTGTLHLFGGDAKALADEIRAVVQKETGLTISAGVSFNKMFAKLGSDYKKPNATTVITRENYKEILHPLPVGDMLYVGAAAARTLQGAGINTIGELATASQDLLRALLGKSGPELSKYANGLDDSAVRPAGEGPGAKSIGSGQTFGRSLVSWADITAGITNLTDNVVMRLRAQGLYCTGVQVTIKDTALHSIQRQCTLPATHLAQDISKAALALVRENVAPGEPIRMLTVTAIGLTAQGGEQLSFFDEGPTNEKTENLETALFQLRQRFGASAVGRGNAVKNTLGMPGLSIQEEGDEDDDFLDMLKKSGGDFA